MREDEGASLTGEERRALRILRGYGDAACYEEMAQAIVRGGADGIVADEEGVLLRHRRADLYMIAARSEARVMELVEQIPPNATDVLLHGDYAPALVTQVRTHFHLRHALRFVNYAYYGGLPEPEPEADIRPLGAGALDFLDANYGHASREYIASRLEEGVMLGAYVDGQLAAFIGEHIEGSMGMLHVMPDYRRHHLGYALERAAIRRTMLAGHTPFDQVVPDNAASHALQERLGMTRACGALYWMTDDTF